MSNTTDDNATVHERLQHLPAKTALPFRQLLKTGQISADVIATIIDAGILAGDTNKLIGFAAGYLHMKHQGVPIQDTIAMAKAQNRRINLAWSPNRWNDEHERLSRLETLQRLSQNNVDYDVKKFARHLPKRFAGYLIRSSRRLGMEGLRQRHCVAIYHERLHAGSCAIAAVFIDRQRWTVELHLTDDKKAPLRIAQIKTRSNGLPPASVRQRIHDMLNIALPKPPPAADSNDERLYMENLRRVLPVLRAANIENVTIEFDGSGDDGSIQDITYQPDRNRDVRNQHIEYLSSDGTFADGQWRTTLIAKQARIDEVIDALTYDYLEETGIDWCNDDGGFGRLEIDVAAGTVSLEVNQRYTESTVEFEAARSIETGEEI